MSSAAEIAAELSRRDSFILTSHARPDGDAIGSSLALAYALEALGKRVRVLNHDAAPEMYRSFPGVDRIEIVSSVDGPADAAVLLECSDLTRPEIAGLDRYAVVNVDHHLGNQMYGVVNWFDGTACACGEQVAEIIDALGVPWTAAIASHLYLAIATDTGGFRYGPFTARTFEICRRIAATGVDPSNLSRIIFDSYSVGRVKLTGALLNAMELHHGGRVALLGFDDVLLKACGATVDDTEGLVNLPLGAREILAVALFKRTNGQTYRVSLRSKGDVDVRAVASLWHGGGHKNASGFTITGSETDVRLAVTTALGQAVESSRDRENS